MKQTRPSKVGRRWMFAVGGWLLGVTVGLFLYFAWKPSPMFVSALPAIAGMAWALWYGERTGKIPSADEVNRPISLFPQDPDDNA